MKIPTPTYRCPLGRVQPEITDLEDMDEARASALIMEARKHWFE